MKVITGGRGEGKTTKIIELCAKNFGYIVCADHRRSRYISDLATTMGLDIPFPITFHDFVENRYYDLGINEFLIDDAHELIQYLSNVPVSAISVCTDSTE